MSFSTVQLFPTFDKTNNRRRGTHAALQTEGLLLRGEGHRRERTIISADVHPGQQAVAVDLDLGLLEGRGHGALHHGVAQAGVAAPGRREDQVDATPPDAEAEQGLRGGEDVDAVPVDDGVI